MDKFAQYSLVIAATVVAIQGVQWKDCGSTKGKIANVKITDCDTAKICNLKRGHNYTISVDFTTAEDVSSATAVVHGVLSGIPVPFPINNPDGCKDSGLTCPLKNGASESYHSTLLVKSVYPKVKVIVKWELKDQNKADLFCVMLPAQIVDGPTKPATKVDNTLRFKPSK